MQAGPAQELRKLCLEPVINFVPVESKGWWSDAHLAQDAVMGSGGGYPSDVSDEEWAFVAPYLALCREDAQQRIYSLREVFNGLR